MTYAGACEVLSDKGALRSGEQALLIMVERQSALLDHLAQNVMVLTEQVERLRNPGPFRSDADQIRDRQRREQGR